MKCLVVLVSSGHDVYFDIYRSGNGKEEAKVFCEEKSRTSET